MDKNHNLVASNLSRRILVAEDMSSISSLLLDILEENGYEVLGPVTTCVDAEKLIAASHLDAALLDVHLADGVSYSVASLLVAHNLPFAFLSGEQLRQLPSEFHNRPAIEKPMSFDSILKLSLIHI